MNEIELLTNGPIKERNQCVAFKKDGEQCQKAPIKGATVCRFHGGAAPAVRKAAKARLENAADRMAAKLLRMTADPSAPHSVKLAAIRDALDRAGMAPNQVVEMEHTLKPYEKVLESIYRGGGGGEVIEGEVVDTADEHHCAECGAVPRAGAVPPAGGWPDLCRACRGADLPDLDDEYAEPDYGRYRDSEPPEHERPHAPGKPGRKPATPGPGGDEGDGGRRALTHDEVTADMAAARQSRRAASHSEGRARSRKRRG